VRFSDLDGASVGVWGAGREIASLAGALAERLPSARIAVAAFDGPPPPGAREVLRAPAAELVSADRAPAALAACDVVVRSPGVSIHRPEIRALLEASVPVTTATALWLEERGGARVIGVTGTKGKSTTAALAAHLLRAQRTPVRLAGNIGTPALDLLGEPDAVAVVELSSYQIADLGTGPEVAVLTNVFPEHADWHGSVETYRAEKLRLLELPGVAVRVLPGRDPSLAALAERPRDRHFAVPDGWDVAAGSVARAESPVVGLSELPLRGEHNALNLCAALTALEALGAGVPPLPAALTGFEALPHRLQDVAERDGVLWVDDSISTTPESAIAALASFPGRSLVLLAGGQDRGQDHAELARAIADRGAAVVGMPSTGPRLIAEALRAGVAPQRALAAADLADAVSIGRGLAGPGSVVLLSPAAPSFDRFRNFEERGERFAELAVLQAR
jgi:UDP-N-acetylmuramoylalanine--D-glutamate ligase